MTRAPKPSANMPAALANLPMPALRDAVALAYATFRHDEPLAFPLDVCLACCCPVDVERESREWPLVQLTARHFYEYNTAAKGLSQPVTELRRLLPRLLELIAAGQEVHHSTELYLCRPGRCPEVAWKEEERLALARFAAAYFDAAIRPGASGCALQVGVDDPLSVLLMFYIGGVEIDPLLELWLRCGDAGSTIQFVEVTYWLFWKDCQVGNSFASDRPAFRARVREWLLDPANRQRFAAKMLAPEFTALAQEQPPVGSTPFGTMVDGVFDQLTQ